VKQKQHPELQRLPLQNGATLARFAIRGAEVHLSAITKLLQHNDPEDDQANYTSPVNNPAIVDALLWRTRAFFWELVGTFDMFLQWANEQFRLGLTEGEVRWDKMPSTSSADNDGWIKMRAVLNTAYNSDWYFEVRTYRNYAHRSIIHVTALVPKNSGVTQVFLPYARVGQSQYEDLRVQLKSFLDQMFLLGQPLAGMAQQGAQADSPASGGPAA
jgi:hypothetical protein